MSHNHTSHLPDGTLLVDTTTAPDVCLRIALAHIAQVTSGGPR
ncbi:MAG TPA: hypothetical protein VGR08_11065 [Thermomicrobiales bacterium]|nr:hypothetical protein [Thermomicrobiales bacterium]